MFHVEQNGVCDDFQNHVKPFRKFIWFRTVEDS